MKFEIKIECKDTEELERIIQSCYFENENNGRLSNADKNCIEISKDDPNFILFKGLNNMTTRVTNDDLIEGVMRFSVNETEDRICLIPCSIYCIKEQDRYSFY